VRSGASAWELKVEKREILRIENGELRKEGMEDGRGHAKVRRGRRRRNEKDGSKCGIQEGLERSFVLKDFDELWCRMLATRFALLTTVRQGYRQGDY